MRGKGRRRRSSSLSRRSQSQVPPNRRRLVFESLEERRMLATFAVTNLNDFGSGSLRQAVIDANNTSGADLIDATGIAGTITIALGEMEITDSLTIEGSGASRLTIDAGLTSRILNFNSSSGDLTLRGLTLTGGRTTGNGVNTLDNTYVGGAIRFLGSGTLAIDQSVITANTTTGDNADGAAIFSEVGNVVLTDSTVSGNRTVGQDSPGGAIRTSQGNVTLTRSTITGNGTSGPDSDGGGIATSNGMVTLNSSMVTGNFTIGMSSAGGGIFAASGDVTLIDSSLTENSTSGTQSIGGGIRSSTGTVELFNSTLANNSTLGYNSDGGGIHITTGSVSVTGSTISGNSTAGDESNGGAIATPLGAVTLTNSTISGNSTSGDDSPGGAIYTLDGALTLNSSTLTNNSTSGSSSNGGGIYLDALNNPTLTILNSIVAVNHAGPSSNNADIDPGSGSHSVNYSLISVDPGGIVGVGNITGMQPTLGPLTFNGGPTQTHALLAGSLGIDMGDPGIVFSSKEFDQRGEPYTRVVDSGGGLRIDMGAFERQNLSGTLVVDTTVDESDGNFSVGDLSLREALELANGTDVDTIEFDAVVFGTPQTISLELGEMQIGESVTINGPGAALVTVDAQQNSRIFNIVANSSDVVLRGMTLTGGRTKGDGVDFNDDGFRGGAIRSESFGTLTIEQTVLAGNQTNGDYAGGGAVFAAFGVLTLTDSTVVGNDTLGDFSGGGGIEARSANVTLNSSDVSGNGTIGTSSSGGGLVAFGGFITINNSILTGNITSGMNASGGAIHSSLTSPIKVVSITNSIISGNRTLGDHSYGGAIRALNNTVMLTNSMVVGNSTAATYGRGGGIATQGGDVILDSSTVSGNSTGGDSAGGGAIWTVSGDITLTDSTVSGNSTQGDGGIGGGIRTNSGDVTLTNSTLSGNTTAGDFAGGGGIQTYTGDIAMFSSTVSGNSTTGASSDGGGIHVIDSVMNASLTIKNSIVANNTVGGGSNNPDISHDPGGVFDPDYSLVGDTSGMTVAQVFAFGLGSGNLPNMDPLLGPLAYNGGPSKTHALLLGSPALDAGDPSILSSPSEFDQRGDPFLRVRQATQGGSLRIDIGAYERQGIPNPSLVVDTALDESDGDYSVGDLSLREALGLANGDVGANTITFDTGLRGSTISLVLGQLEVTDSVTITGLGADLLTIDAQQDSRVFDIYDGDDTTALNVTISGLTITGGRTFGSGGGIRVRENFELFDSHVTNNQSIGTGLVGTSGGGIDINTFSSTTTSITGSTISGNIASGNGGGVRVASYAGETFTMTNTTLSGNISAISGGGIAFTGNGNATIAHSTIAFNTADADASGPFGGGAGGGLSRVQTDVTLDHTVVGSNTDVGGPDNDLSGTITANYSLFGNTTGATINGANNILNQDPRLAPLADNGGPTPTHSLLPISPALNTGNIGIAGAPMFDQRGPGFTRIVGIRIDRGALEVQDPSADFDFDGDVDGRDFLLWQRGFGTPMPLATKSDGDADNDTDVDGNDLAIWQIQYGTSGLIAVNAQTSATDADSSSTPLSEIQSEGVSGSELLDLALTVEWLSRTAEESKAPIRDDQRFIEAAYDAVFSGELIAPRPFSPDRLESLQEDRDGDVPLVELWLSEELLERVFG